MIFFSTMARLHGREGRGIPRGTRPGAPRNLSARFDACFVAGVELCRIGLNVLVVALSSEEARGRLKRGIAPHERGGPPGLD